MIFSPKKEKKLFNTKKLLIKKNKNNYKDTKWLIFLAVVENMNLLKIFLFFRKNIFDYRKNNFPNRKI